MSLPSTTLYMPIVSPPTPAPSPRLPAFDSSTFADRISDPGCLSQREFATLPPSLRLQYLSALLADCSPAELLFISARVTPLLRRDFLRDLPPEIALHILSFLDDPKSLVRASRVSRTWNRLLSDQWIWKRMCDIHGYDAPGNPGEYIGEDWGELEDERCPQYYSSISVSAPTISALASQSISTRSLVSSFSYRKHFQHAYTTTVNWLRGGKMLRTHRIQSISANQLMPLQRNAPNAQGAAPSSAIPTSVALDDSWVVVGLANSRIHVFSARSGVLSRTLVGHESGVWAVALVRGSPGESDADEAYEGDNFDEMEEMSADADVPDPLMPPTLRRALGLNVTTASFGKQARRRSASDMLNREREAKERSSGKAAWSDKPSDPNGASDGWGQSHALVVSGGCDKELRVWDVKSGYCIYVLRGHTSTVRCLKVLHGRPIAISGSRDRTLRVWDVQRGRLLRVLEGHAQSVRCLDVCGSRVVSGSYDHTCRIWDIDTGECLHVLRGHFHQIYSVAFDGVRIASGGLDTTVRVWDADTGTCLALLQGHTALVCQIQLSPTMLTTGGADGRVITFALNSSFSIVQRLAAHDSSVTGLQTDERFLVTSGNDGRVRLFSFERDTGKCEYVRDLTELSESVWKVAFTRETCAIMCKRAGKTVMEIWSFKPEE